MTSRCARSGPERTRWPADRLWEGVDSHLHNLWITGRSARYGTDLSFHTRSTLKWRNPNEIRHLRVFRRCLSCCLSVGYTLRPPAAGSLPKDGSGGTSGRSLLLPRARCSAIRCTSTEQVKPVACFIHSDLAPRDAVRTAGPRLGPTRSAHEDEPGGTAIRPGDGSRGPDQPSRAVQQPTTATGRRTAAAMPRPRDSHRAERPCSHDCTGVPFLVHDQDQSSAVGRNRGGTRRAVARSNACAIRISLGSLQAGPKNEIPTGSPKL